jgi:glycogen operon protein
LASPQVESLLLLFNAHHDEVPFTLPEIANGREWLLLLDTRFSQDEDALEAPVVLAMGATYALKDRSVAVLALRPSHRQTTVGLRRARREEQP